MMDKHKALRRNLKQMEKDGTLNIDSFGEIIDNFLVMNHVQLLVDMPEGTQEVTIRDNTGLGAVTQFYILLKALPEVYRNFGEILGMIDQEGFVTKSLEMVKDVVLGEGEESE